MLVKCLGVPANFEFNEFFIDGNSYSENFSLGYFLSPILRMWPVTFSSVNMNVLLTSFFFELLTRNLHII